MSEQGDDKPEKVIPSHGVVVRAKNGDVIRYDPTGLVMRLSDRVIEDIALRMGHRAETSAVSTPRAGLTTASPPAAEDALEGVDAWNIRSDGDWLRFTARLPGAQGVRGFLRHCDGGAILADGPGAVLGILGLGGPRAALATPGAPAFPQHIVAPADDIGAVGMAGVEPAPETDRLEHLREVTHEALVAETLLHWQMADYAPLPLIVTRAETDSSASAADLAKGPALDNLLQAAKNLKSAATLMGKRAKILAVCLDYALEDLTGDPIAYRDGMLAAMKAVEDGLWSLGFDKPLFVARFENGLAQGDAAGVLAGQWELSWNHGDHNLVYSAPAYMFEHDRFDRPTEAARRQMAKLTAAAIRDGANWRCPIFFLAEHVAGDRRVIRVTVQAASAGLRLDEPEGTGTDQSLGFALLDDTSGATITKVEIDPDDPLALLVHCDRAPEGDGLRLCYAAHGAGGVSDLWGMATDDGAELRRYALPAILPVHDGPKA